MQIATPAKRIFESPTLNPGQFPIGTGPYWDIIWAALAPELSRVRWLNAVTTRVRCGGMQQRNQ